MIYYHHHDRPPANRTVQAARRRLVRTYAEKVYAWEPSSRRKRLQNARYNTAWGKPQPVRRAGAVDVTVRGPRYRAL